MVISATSGTGGIGKTWLTLYWAHQQRDRFPDGQLFVDLRGFSPEGRPMAPETAVRGFLHALGVQDTQIPSSLDAQAALWRTLLADKHMLIVLDNAADTAQVRPLLPGGSTNTVFVNSRDHLTGLVTSHGAYRVDLDILSDIEARDLLRARLGQQRLAAEPEAVDELLDVVRRIPAGAEHRRGAGAEPPRVLARHARRRAAREPTRRVGRRRSGRQPAPVLSWSYAALTEEQARVFGLLGIAPGPDISLSRGRQPDQIVHPGHPKRVARAGPRLAAARGRAGPLRDARPGPRLRAGKPPAPRTRTGCAASSSSTCAPPTRANSRSTPAEAVTAPEASSGVQPIVFDGVDEVMAWFAGEYGNLSALQHDIATRQWDESIWRLGWALGTFRYRTGRVLDEVASWRTGLAAVLRIGDPALEALARQLLGNACARAELFTESVTLLTESIRLAKQIGDVLTEAFSERGLGRTWGVQGRMTEALTHNKRALALFEEIGYPVWIANELNNVGWVAAHLGDYEYAKSCCEKALEMNQTHLPDDPSLTGMMLDSLGFIAAGMGRYEDAIGYYEQARAQYASNDDTYFDAETLDHLGHPYRAMGKLDKARETWQAAVRLYREHKRFADVQRIQLLLDELDTE